LWREAFHPVDEARRPGIGRPRLALLLLRERGRAQGEQLVDLGGVEEITGALGGDRRMVVEDDRCGENEIAAARLPREHREKAVALADARRLPREVGWVEQRQEGEI